MHSRRRGLLLSHSLFATKGQKADRLTHVGHLFQVDIQQFKMAGADLGRSGGRYLTLAVPGLAEKRPSVLYGDRVFVHFPEQPRKEYEVMYCWLRPKISRSCGFSTALTYPLLFHYIGSF
jgi:hypothetical protein